MPNWCQTKITINHEDGMKLKELETLIDKWISVNYLPNGFGLNWLGNIVGNAGIGTIDNGKDTDLRCRGVVTYMELRDEQLIIDTETAWSPMLKMWVKLLEKYLPDAELIYEAEECGNGLYSTNDPYLKEKYIVDAWDMEDIESDWEASEDYVREILQKLLQTDETNIATLLNKFEDSDYSYNMIIHKWDFDEIDIWD